MFSLSTSHLDLNNENYVAVLSTIGLSRVEEWARDKNVTIDGSPAAVVVVQVSLLLSSWGPSLPLVFISMYFKAYEYIDQ